VPRFERLNTIGLQYAASGQNECGYEYLQYEYALNLVNSLNVTPVCPDSWAKAVLNIYSNLRIGLIDYENRLRAMPQSAESIFC
jgi:hypothetical protein